MEVKVVMVGRAGLRIGKDNKYPVCTPSRHSLIFNIVYIEIFERYLLCGYYVTPAAEYTHLFVSRRGRGKI